MNKKDVFYGVNPDKKFMLDKLNPGDVFASEHRFYKLDPEHFNFGAIDKRVQKIDRNKFKRFMESNNVDFDTETLIRLFCFQNYIKDLFPNYMKNSDAEARHRVSEKYNASKNHPMLLSAAFLEGVVSCAEMSLVAQMYMQHCGIKSSFWAGNMFTNTNVQDKSSLRGDAHAFVEFRVGDKRYFYDAVNPFRSRQNEFPAIMDYSGVSKKERLDFASRLLQPVSSKGRGATYIEARDIYNKGRSWLYGFDCLGNNAGLVKMSEGAIKRISSNYDR